MAKGPNYKELAQRIQLLEEKVCEASFIEKQLRESREKFRALVDSSPVAVMICQDDHWISANKSAEDHFGYSIRELLKQNYWDIVHPEFQQALRRCVHDRQAVEEGSPGCELKVITKDGKEKWFSFTVATTHIGGRPSSLISATDISDRKKNEEVLLKEKDLLQTILNGAGRALLAYFDRDYHFVSVNKNYAESCGYRPEDLVGKNVFTLFPDRENRAIFTKVRDTGENFEVRDKPYIFPDQPERGVTYWDWTLTAVKDPEGRVIGLVQSASETTQRKESEEALVRETGLLQTIMDGAGRAQLVYLDRDFNFIRVNESYARGCGYRPKEMIGKNHFALYPNSENEAIFRQVRDTGESFEVRDKPFAFPDQPERGVTYWDWTLTPVKDQSGLVTGLVFSLHETTKRKRAEEQLQESEARYRFLHNNTRDGFVRFDLDGQIRECNEAFASMLGYPAAELETLNLKNVLPEKSHVSLYGFIESQLEQKGCTEILEEEFQSREGAPFPTEVRMVLIRDRFGKPSCIWASVRDISKRKRRKGSTDAGVHYQAQP